MKRVVMYARYSTENQSERSINDQFRNCERYAEKENWMVVGKYFDEAITGAVSKRPDYKRLMQDAEKGVFEILLIDDLSRFARDDLEMKISLRKLMAWGIRVIGVSEGYDTTNKGHKIHAGMRGIMNEMYIDDVRDKTHRGLTGKVLDGFSSGGRCYGYKSLPIEHDIKKDEHGRPLIIASKRAIDEEEAKWVRRIFEWFGDGRSARWIAGELNRLCIASSRGGTWSASAIHGVAAKQTGMLNNPTYIGKVVWNRRQWLKDPESGKRRYIQRPMEEWIEQEHPELRIVSDELWQDVQKRKRNSLKAYENMTSGKISTAPHKHLFSGLLVCGICGLSYAITAPNRYGCTGHRNRGDSFCHNTMRASKNIVERNLLNTLKGYLFTDEAVSIFIDEVKRQIKMQMQDRASLYDNVRRELRESEKIVQNLLNVLKQGVITQTIKEELEIAEKKCSMLKNQLREGEGDIEEALRKLPEAKALFQNMLKKLEESLSSDTSKARLILSKMIHGKIKMYPTTKGYLEAEMQGNYSCIVELHDDMEKVLGKDETRNQFNSCNQTIENMGDFSNTCNQSTGLTCNQHTADVSVGCGERI